MASSSSAQPLGPLHIPITSVSKRRQVVENLWPGYRHASTANESDLVPFFKYYTSECRFALHDDARHISVRTNEDIIGLAKCIVNGKSRQELFTALQIADNGQENQAERLNSSTNLTARLMSMVDIGSIDFGIAGRTHLSWENGSLKSRLHDYFNKPSKLYRETVRLEKILRCQEPHEAGCG